MKFIFGVKIIVNYSKIFFASILFVFLLIFIINITIGGTPRYYEILANQNIIKYQEAKEKLVQYKLSKTINKNFQEPSIIYNKNNPPVIKNCGKFESGLYNLIYLQDVYGFRENKNNLYNKSDYILLGDSFVESICINKPNDLKSNLEKISEKNFLNLGKEGTDYPQQLENLIFYTNETEFYGIIWFFYEGNDYESKFSKDTKNKIEENKIKNKKFYSKEELENFDKNQQEYSYNYIIFDSKLTNIKFNQTIDLFFKIKVYTSEFIKGPTTLLKFFFKYNTLLDEDDYNFALSEANKFLENKKINQKFIYYLPSWQKLSLHKLYKFKIFNNHPQIKQFEELKNSVKKVAEANNFIFIDGSDFFMNLEKPLEVFHYNLNTHFNSLGYELLANDLNEKIVKKYQINHK